MVFQWFFYMWTIGANGFSMVFQISTIGINGFSNGFHRWTIAIEWMVFASPLTSMVFQWFWRKRSNRSKTCSYWYPKIYPILSWNFIDHGRQIHRTRIQFQTFYNVDGKIVLQTQELFALWLLPLQHLKGFHTHHCHWMNGWKATIDINSFRMVLVWQTIGSNGFTMVFSPATIGTNGFSMVL